MQILEEAGNSNLERMHPLRKVSKAILQTAQDRHLTTRRPASSVQLAQMEAGVRIAGLSRSARGLD